MRQSTLENSIFIENHESRLRLEWLARQADMQVFRATPEERAAKLAEGPFRSTVITLESLASGTAEDIHAFAEQLARTGREGVRFERWKHPEIHGKA